MATKTYYLSRILMLIVLFLIIFLSSSCGGSDKFEYDIPTDPGIIENPGDGGDNSTGDVDDSDGDGIIDENDNCIYYSNADQADFDGDGAGDECDIDDDGDGVKDKTDACPYDATGTSDPDEDGLCEGDDNCTEIANEDQADMDADGIGDLCDDDKDGDGAINEADNCELIANADQADLDEDGIGDVCDDDIDGDTILNEDDNCEIVANTDQLDSDGDGVGDVCEDDTDGDGVLNADDNCPEIANEDQSDLDEDGFGDLCDNCPEAANEDQAAELDDDEIGDACDTDNDNDGYENALGSYSDCDDSDASINPAATEYLDFIDSNCDGDADTDLLLSDASTIITGTTDHFEIGTKTVIIPDVNGDGYDDILIAEPAADSGSLSDAGKVYLFFGSDELDQELTPSNANVIFFGANTNDQLGTSMAGIGDINGDGYGDILLGSPGNNDAGTDAGKVYLIYGRAQWSVVMGRFSFGSSTAITSKLTSSIFPLAKFFSMSRASATFTGQNAGDAFGSAISAAGDINGDGTLDFMISAIGYDLSSTEVSAGAVYVFFGQNYTSNTSASSANVIFTGEDGNDNIGTTIAAGNINGDAYDDILIGAPYASDGYRYEGVVYVIYGSNSLSGTNSVANANAIIQSEFTGEKLGTNMAVGDFNGDGHDDFALTAPYANNNTSSLNGAGKISIFLGSNTEYEDTFNTSEANITILGSAENENIGLDISLSGDLDADGLTDLVFSAPVDDSVGTDSGKVYFFKGSSLTEALTATNPLEIDLSTTAADLYFLGEAAGDNAGTSISQAGDINNDGKDDLVISAPGFTAEESTTNNGKVYLFLTH